MGIGFFINYGASVRLSDTPLQYRLVIAIPLIPVGLALIASFRLHDTPSWLISRNRCDEARKAMRLLRQGDDEASLTAAMDHIVFSIESRNYEMQGVSNLSAIKEIATNQSYRKRFLLSSASFNFFPYLSKPDLDQSSSSRSRSGLVAMA